MNKFWFDGVPLVVGSLRWRVVHNDLLNEMGRALAEWRKLYGKTNLQNHAGGKAARLPDHSAPSRSVAAAVSR